jgi:hypothetical protein
MTAVVGDATTRLVDRVEDETVYIDRRDLVWCSSCVQYRGRMSGYNDNKARGKLRSEMKRGGIGGFDSLRWPLLQFECNDRSHERHNRLKSDDTL